MLAYLFVLVMWILTFMFNNIVVWIHKDDNDLIFINVSQIFIY